MGRGKASRPVDEQQCPAGLRPQQRWSQRQRAGTDGGWVRTAWAREARLSGLSSVCRSASNSLSSLSPPEPAGASSAGSAAASGSGVAATLRRRRRPRPRREVPPSVLAGLAPGRRQRLAHTGDTGTRPPHCRGAERVGQQQRVVGRRRGGRGNGGRRSALISSGAIASQPATSEKLRPFSLESAQSAFPGLPSRRSEPAATKQVRRAADLARAHLPSPASLRAKIRSKARLAAA